jgi:fatty-acyl-CoA synthase
MFGLMQDHPLLISSLLDYAERYHPQVEIVSGTCEGGIVRSDYATLAGRARKLAEALAELGVKQGDVVTTMAWNTHRHVELYFAVSGMGAILHTVNPRLYHEQIDYIVNHAGSGVLLFDITFSQMIGELREKLPNIRHFIAMTDEAHRPGDAGDVLCYESLIEPMPGEFVWPKFDERTASSLCYTSGTTGNPKGVLYSHRSSVLHSFLVCQADGFRLSSHDTTLLVVPLFHVNAWGVPYASAMCGAKLVLPGPRLEGKSIFDLAVAEKCTFTLGVPTVWLGLLHYIETTPGLSVSDLPFERLVIGGSAAPRAMIEKIESGGIRVMQAWGMTETSPVATVCNFLPRHKDLDAEARLDIQVKQGRALYGVELRIVDEDGHALAHDGRVSGNLLVRGPWVAAGYYGLDNSRALDAEGWFPTGDVARIDPEGYVTLTDRSKDVIKSGGEWISSIDLENAAMGHPDVQEAAIIGVAHPKWQERPLLIVVRKAGTDPRPEEILSYIAERVAKWWLPDDVVFVDEIPHTATGKIQKLKLRELFREHVLPSA